MSNASQTRFPPDLHGDPERHLLAIQSAPIGLRAMAAAYPFDVSIAMNDLASHFFEHHDERLLQETYSGLRELGLTQAAELFRSAWEIVEPYFEEIRTGLGDEDPDDYFERTGIQAKVTPLDRQLRAEL